MANYLQIAGNECAVLTVSTASLPLVDPLFVVKNSSVKEIRVPPGWIVPHPLKCKNGKEIGLFHKIIRRIALLYVPDAYYFLARRAAKAFIHEPPFRPDIVISSCPPFSAHYAGFLISKAFRARWIAEFRDLWVGNHYKKRSALLAGRYKRYQSTLLKNSDLVIGVSDEMSTVLREDLPTGKKIETLMNAYEDKTVHEHNQVSLEKHFLTFAYTGGIYRGFQDLRPLFGAFRKIKEDMSNNFSHPRLIYAGSQGKYILSDAGEVGLAHMVKDMGYLPRNEVLSLQRKADILVLSIGSGNEKESMVITGKVFEYLCAKRPILAIGYPEGALGRLLKETKAGYIRHPADMAGITGLMRLWMKEFTEKGYVSFYGDERAISKHSWKCRVNELLELIKQIPK
jgi:glycosyltransferase involved in cell wall biosynthesis